MSLLPTWTNLNTYKNTTHIVLSQCKYDRVSEDFFFCRFIYFINKFQWSYDTSNVYFNKRRGFFNPKCLTNIYLWMSIYRRPHTAFSNTIVGKCAHLTPYTQRPSKTQTHLHTLRGRMCVHIYYLGGEQQRRWSDCAEQRLFCVFVVRLWQKQVFSWHGSLRPYFSLWTLLLTKQRFLTRIRHQ